MNATKIVFPDHFEVLSAKGNLLKMTRLYRFRQYENNALVAQDYIVAMESKHVPFLNHPEWLDVFKIDPITGVPLWVPLDNDEIYAAARSRYDNYQSSSFFLDEYRKRLCKKYDPEQILPYMEELEIKLLSEQDAREIALSLLCDFNKKLKVLRSLHKAICATGKGDDVRIAADNLVFGLWASVEGLEVGTKLLREVSVKDTLLDALYDLILIDAGNSLSTQRKTREFILNTYWAQPKHVEEIYRAIKTHFDKAGTIKRLLELHDKLSRPCDVSKEDIHNLWFVEPWRFLTKRYWDEVTRALNQQ